MIYLTKAFFMWKSAEHCLWINFLFSETLNSSRVKLLMIYYFQLNFKYQNCKNNLTKINKKKEENSTLKKKVSTREFYFAISNDYIFSGADLIEGSNLSYLISFQPTREYSLNLLKKFLLSFFLNISHRSKKKLLSIYAKLAQMENFLIINFLYRPTTEKDSIIFT